MSERGSSMTYRLKQGEIVDATFVPVRRLDPVSHLRRIGVRLYRGPNGSVHGRLSIDPMRLIGIDGLLVEPVQEIRLRDTEHLVFVPPSPLSRLGAFRFAGAKTFEELQDALEFRWQELVSRTNGALQLARTVAPNARVMAHPWRIEGSVRVHYEDLRLLFSPTGDRACVCGINGKALVVQPAEPRVVIPVPLKGPETQVSELWSRAIAQAEACLAPHVAVDTSHDDEALSLDLADLALNASYGAQGPPGTTASANSPADDPDVPVLRGVMIEAPEEASGSESGSDPSTAEAKATAQRTYEALTLDLSEDMSTDFTSADLPG